MVHKTAEHTGRGGLAIKALDVGWKGLGLELVTRVTTKRSKLQSFEC